MKRREFLKIFGVAPLIATVPGIVFAGEVEKKIITSIDPSWTWIVDIDTAGKLIMGWQQKTDADWVYKEQEMWAKRPGKYKINMLLPDEGLVDDIWLHEGLQPLAYLGVVK